LKAQKFQNLTVPTWVELANAKGLTDQSITRNERIQNKIVMGISTNARKRQKKG
jgi:hypothetical protein